MADARAIATARLLSARATARRGLLASATATVAIAVATVCALLAWLVVAVQRAGDAAPPGVPQDEVDAQVEDGVIALVSAAPALVLLVVIVAATAAAQLARLLAAAREQETANLRARGLSRGQASTANGIESAAVGVVGAIGGVALAALLLLIVNRGMAELVSLWWVAVVTAAILASVMVVAVTAPFAGGRAGRSGHHRRRGRGRRLGGRVRPLAAATRAPHGFRPDRGGRAHRRADGGRARRARGVRRGCRRMGDSGRGATRARARVPGTAGRAASADLRGRGAARRAHRRAGGLRLGVQLDLDRDGHGLGCSPRRRRPASRPEPAAATLRDRRRTRHPSTGWTRLRLRSSCPSRSAARTRS